MRGKLPLLLPSAATTYGAALPLTRAKQLHACLPRRPRRPPPPPPPLPLLRRPRRPRLRPPPARRNAPPGLAAPLQRPYPHARPPPRPSRRAPALRPHAPRASFDLFRQMCYSGRRPDSILLASVLSACASTASISCGMEIHCYAVRLGADMDIRVSSSLMDAYAKCGFAELGYWVFRQMPNKNSVMYNTVISNLGSHGFAMKAIEVLDEMVHDKLRPDSATFSALLAACCHARLLDEGWKLFRRMRDEFHIVVKMEHYVYMVRLLATFGQLKEAYDLIQTMPIPPDCGVWGALLWGCCVHRDSSLGRVVAEKLFEFYPDKAAYRIMLSNLYASQEMWWDAEEVRAELSKEYMHKNTGISWVG